VPVALEHSPSGLCSERGQWARGNDLQPSADGVQPSRTNGAGGMPALPGPVDD
jgi:hypothetical protein